MRSGLPTIIGRDHERAMLDARLRSAVAGEGQLLLLTGEPGIGKTRLAQYASERATGLGMRCCWAHASEQAATPPYWLFRQIVRDSADDELLRELGPAARDLAVVAPETGRRTSARRATEDRFAVFEAVTAYLIALSRRTGALIVLDDLQWADAASGQLLAYLASGIDTA